MIQFALGGEFLDVFLFRRLQSFRNHVATFCFHGFEFLMKVEMALELPRV